MSRLVGRGLAPLLVLVTTLVTPAAAELYQWTDTNGVLHYTSDLESVPAAARPIVRDVGSPRPREATTAATRPAGDPGVMRFGGGAPIMATVTINGVGLRLMVDTGADRTMLSPDAVARAGLSADGGRAVRIAGVTGVSVGRELVLPEMDVAGARVGPVGVIVHETLGGTVDGLLGRDVLDFFTLTLDPGAGRATLTPR